MPYSTTLLVASSQLLPRRVGGEAVLLADRVEHPVEVLAAEPGPRRDRAVGDAEVVVGDDQLGIDLEAGAEPVAALARAVGRVEREVARRELVERQAAVRAREVLRERERLAVLVVLVLAVPRDDLDLGDTLGEAQRGLERVGEPALDAGPAHQPVDDDLDRVLLVRGLRAARRSAASSTSSCSSPSIRARVKPWPASSLSSPSYSPLRPRTTGASTWNRVPSGQLEHAVDDLLRASGG